MLAKFRRLSFSSVPCKVQFTIDLQDLTISEIRDEITLLCIELERKSKSVSTASKLWSEKTVPSIFQFNETLTIVVTLYKDASGKYMEKKAKVVLRGHSKITRSALSLGSVNLKLHALAASFNPQKLKLQLKDMKGNVFGIVNSTITAKFLSDVTGDDDFSVISGESDSASLNSSFSVRHAVVYKDSYDNQLRNEDLSKNETDKLRQSIRNIRTELDSSTSSIAVLRDLEQSSPASVPNASGKRRGGFVVESKDSPLTDAEMSLRSQVAQLQIDLDNKNSQHLAVMTHLQHMERRASLAEQKSVRLFEDLELASGQMDEGQRKDELMNKIALSTQVEKTKEEILSVSVEREKLKMDLIESNNNMLLLQSKLDATQLENAAVQAAVLSIEIQKLYAAIKQYKEQAHISTTEKKGLMNELESIRAEAGEAELRNRKIRELEMEKEELLNKLFRSTSEGNLSRNKVDSLQADMVDLHTRLTTKEEEIKFFKNASFANTKKNESEKADLQVKLSVTQSKLDATLNKLELSIADREKNKRRDDDEIKTLKGAIQTLETRLEELSHKNSGNVSSNIAASIKSKKDISALIEAGEEKDAEILLYRKQNNKSVVIVNNLYKLIAGLEQLSESKCKDLNIKLASESEHLKALKVTLNHQAVSTEATKNNNSRISKEKGVIEEHLKMKNDEVLQSAAAVKELECAVREQKSECFKAKIDLENSKRVIEKLSLEHDASVGKNKAVMTVQKELDASLHQIEELIQENKRLILVQDNYQKNEELHDQLQAAEEWQSTIAHEVGKLQAITDSSQKKLLEKELELEALKSQLVLETQSTSEQLVAITQAAEAADKVNRDKNLSLNISIETLKLELDAKSSEYALKNDEKTKAVESLQREFLSTKKAISGEVTKLEEEVASLNKALRGKDVELDLLRKDTASVVKNLSTKYDNTCRRESEQSEKLVKVTSELSKLQAELATSQKILLGKEVESEALRKDSECEVLALSEQLDIINQAAASMEMLQHQLSIANNKHAMQSADKSKVIDNLQKELGDTRARMGDVLAEKTKLSEKGDESSRKVCDLSEQLSKAAERETALTSEVSKLQAEVAASQEASHVKESDLQAIKVELDAAISDHKAQVAAKAKAAESSQKELRSTKAKMESVVMEKKQVEAVQKEIITDLTYSVGDLSERLSKATERETKLKAEIASSNKILLGKEVESEALRKDSECEVLALSEQLDIINQAAASMEMLQHQLSIANNKHAMQSADKSKVIDNLQKELGDTRARMGDVLAEKTKLSEKGDESSRKVCDLSEQLSKAAERETALTSEVASSHTAIESANGVIAARAAEIEALKATLKVETEEAEKKKKAIDAFDIEVRDAKAAIAKADALAATQVASAQQAEVIARASIAELNESAKVSASSILQLKTDMESKVAEIAALKVKMASGASSSEKTLQLKEDAADVLRRQLGEAESKGAALKKELETSQTRVHDAGEQIKAGETKNAELSCLLASFKDKLKSERETGAVTLSGLSERLQSELDALNSDHAAQSAETAKVIDNLQKELGDTRARMGDVLAEKTKLSEKGDESSRKVCDLSEQLSKAAERETALTSEVASSHTAIESANGVIAARAAEIEALKATLKVETEEAEKKKKAIDALDIEVRDAKAAIAKADALAVTQVASAQQAEVIARASIAELNESAKVSASSILQLKTDMESKVAEIAALKVKMASGASSSEKTLQLKEDAADVLRRQLGEAESKGAALKKELETSQTRVHDAGEQIKAGETKNAELSCLLASFKDKLKSERETGAVTLSGLSERLQSELDALNSDHAAQSAETAKVIDNLQKELGDTRARMGDVLAEKTKLSEKGDESSRKVCDLSEQLSKAAERETALTSEVASSHTAIESANGVIAARAAEIEALKATLKVEKEEAEKKKKAIDALDIEVRDAKAAIAKADALAVTQVASAQQAEVIARASIAELNESAKVSASSILQLKTDVESKVAEIAALKVKMASGASSSEKTLQLKEDAADVLRRQLGEAESKGAALKKELETSQTRVHDAGEQIKAGETKNAELSCLLASFKDKLKSERETGAVTLSGLSERLQSELDALNSDHAAQSAEMAKVIDNLQKELGDTRARMGDVLAEKTKLSEKGDESSRKVCDLSEQLSKAAERETALTSEVASSHTAIESANGVIAARAAEIEALKATLKVETEEAEKKKKAIDALDIEVRDAKAAIAKADALAVTQVASAQQAEVIARASIAELNESAKVSASSILQLKTDMESKVAEIAALKVKMASGASSSEKTLQLKEDAADVLRRQLGEAESKGAALKKELETSQTRVHDAGEQIKAGETKNAELSCLLASFKDKLKSERETGAVTLSGLSERLQSELDALNSDHAAQSAETAKVIDNLQKELGDTRARMGDVLAEKTKLSEKGDESSRKVCDLSEQLSKAAERETALTSEVASSHTAIESANGVIAARAAEIEALKATLKVETEEAEKKKKAIDAFDIEVRDAKAAIAKADALAVTQVASAQQAEVIARASIAELNESAKVSASSILQLKTDMESKVAEIAALKVKMASGASSSEKTLQLKEDAADVLRRQLGEAESKGAALKKELETSQTRVHDAGEQIKAGETKNAELSCLLASFKDKLKSERETGAVTLSGLSERLQSELDALNSDHAAQSAETAKVIDNLQKELGDTRARMGDVLAEKTKLSEKGDESSRKVCDLSEQLSKAAERETALTSEVASSHTAIESANGVIAARAAEIEALKATLKVEKEEAEKKKKAIDALDIEVRDAKAAIAKADALAVTQVASAQQAEVIARASIAELNESAKVSASSILQLKTDMESKVAEIAALKLKMASGASSSEKTLQLKEDAADVLRRQLGEAESKGAALKKELETSQTRVHDAGEQIKAGETKNAELSCLLASFKDKLKSERETGAVTLSDLSERLQSELDALNSDHAAQSAETAKVIDNLQKELGDTRARMGDVLAEKTKLSEKGDESSRKVCDLSEQLSKAAERETALTSEVASSHTAIESANGVIAARAAEIEALKATLKVEKEEAEKKKKAIDALDIEVRDAKAAIAKADALAVTQVASAQQAEVIARASIAELNESAKVSASSILQLKTDMESKVAEIAALKVKMASGASSSEKTLQLKEDAADVLRRQLGEAESKGAALKKELETSQTRVHDAGEQIKAGETKNAELSCLLASFKDKLKSERETGAVTLSDLSERLQSELDALNSDHAAQSAETAKVIDNLQKELGDTRARMGDVLAEKTKLSEKGDESSRKVCDLSEQLSKAAERETALTSEVASSHTAIESANGVIAARAAEIEALKATLKVETEEAEKKKKAIDALDIEVRDAKAAIAKADALVVTQVASAQQAEVIARASIAELNESAKVSASSILQLKTDMESKVAEIAALKVKMASGASSSEKTLQLKEDAADVLRRQLGEAESKGAALKKELETSQTRVHDAGEQIKAGETKNAELSCLLASFKDKLKSERETGAVTLSGLSERLQSELDALNSDHAAQSAETAKVIDNLQKELGDTRARMGDVLAEKTKLSEKGDESSRKVCDLSEQLSKAAERETALTSEVASSHTAIESANGVIAARAAEIEALKATLKVETEEAEKKKKAIDALDIEVRDAKAAIAKADALVATQVASAQQAEVIARASIAELNESAKVSASSILQLKTDMESKVAEIAALKLKMASGASSSEKTLQLKEDAADVLRRQLGEAESKGAALKKELETSQTRVHDAGEQIKAGETKNAELSCLLASFKDKLKSERETGAVTLSGLSERLQSELDALNSDHAAQSAETAKVIDNLQKELGDTRARMGDVLAEKTKLSEKGDESSRKVCDLSEQLSKAAERETALTSEVASSHTAIESANGVIAARAAEIEALKATLKVETEEAEKKKKAIDALDIEVRDAKAAIAKADALAVTQVASAQQAEVIARASIAELNESAKVSASSILQLKTDMESKVAEIAALKVKMASGASSSEKTLQLKEDAADVLRRQLGEAESKGAALKKEIEALTQAHGSKILSLAQESEKQAKERAAMDSLFVAQTAESERLRSDLNSLTTVCGETKDKAALADGQAKKVIESANGVIAARAAEIEALKATLKVETEEAEKKKKSLDAMIVEKDVEITRLIGQRDTSEVKSLALQKQMVEDQNALNLKLKEAQLDIENHVVTLLEEQTRRDAEQKNADAKIEMLYKEAKDASSLNDKKTASLVAEISSLQMVNTEVEKKHTSALIILSEKSALVVQLKQETDALKLRHEADLQRLQRCMADDAADAKAEIHLITLENKVAHDNLTRSLEVSARDLAAAKKESSALLTENTSIKNDLEKALQVNDTLKTNSANDTLKFMKDNAILLEKNQNMLSTIEENKVFIATSGSKSKDLLNILEIEKKSLTDQLKRVKETAVENEEIALEKSNSSVAEKNKLKADIKRLQHQDLAKEVMRKDELARAITEKEKVIEESEDLRSQLCLSEMRIIQNAATFEAEKERIFTLETSKAQISAAEARIIFSTEKRKLKEEISNLNIRINQIESEATDYKSSYSGLEGKMKELELAAIVEKSSAEERIVNFLKAMKLYDSDIHGNGNMLQSGSWVETLRSQLEKENMKNSTLKQFLSRFKDKLDHEDFRVLNVADVIF